MEGVPFPALDAQCNLYANAQLYPLGFRIGFYLQWFATILASFFVPKASSSQRTATTLFQLATLAGVCYASKNLMIDSIEAFILLSLSLGGGLAAMIRSPNLDIRITRVGTLCRLVILLAAFIYGGWFWFQGHKYMMHSSCTNQIQFVFFWKVHLYHWFASLCKAIVIIGSIATGVAILYEFFLFINCFRMGGLRPTVNSILDNSLIKDSVLGGVLLQEKYAWISGALLMVTMVVVAAFITTIESALKYSHAGNVGNIGTVTELVPFLFGLWNLAKVFLGLIKASYNAIYGNRGDAKELDMA